MVPEEEQEHIREVLSKGKEIVPFYSVRHLMSIGLSATGNFQEVLPE